MLPRVSRLQRIHQPNEVSVIEILYRTNGRITRTQDIANYERAASITTVDESVTELPRLRPRCVRRTIVTIDEQALSNACARLRHFYHGYYMSRRTIREMALLDLGHVHVSRRVVMAIEYVPVRPVPEPIDREERAEARALSRAILRERREREQMCYPRERRNRNGGRQPRERFSYETIRTMVPDMVSTSPLERVCTVHDLPRTANRATREQRAA